MAASAGITPERFWRLTPREIVVAIEGRARALRDEWDIARHHAMWIVNEIRAAVNGSKATFATAQDLVKFPDEMPKQTAASADDYTTSMRAMKMREESAIFWDDPKGAPIAELRGMTAPRAMTRGRKRASVKR